MENSIAQKLGLRLYVLAFWGGATLAGLTKYQGSALLFCAFSLAFYVLVIDILRHPANISSSISYCFLVAFLTLGFWVKLILHLVVVYHYREPIGYFDGTPKAWDQVLLVTVTGVAGVLAAKYFMLAGFRLFSQPASPPAPMVAPAWWPCARKWTWFATTIAVVSLAALNWHLGIAQVGLVSRLNLPWPLNGLTAWLFGFGLIAWILTLLAWDQASGRGFFGGVTMVLAEGFLSTISILSRAGYLFHTAPTLLLLFFGRHATKRQNGLIGLLWIALLAASLITVNYLRYGEQPVTHAEETVAPNINALERIAGLFIDRWIGLEGVMAVVSYPEKSMDLLEAGLTERRFRSNLDLYTADIARVDSNLLDVNVVQYASLPGAIAFFYYSGLLPYVFIGVFVLVLMMWGAERLVLRVSNNLHLAAFWAMSTAQAVVSFGVGNLQTFQYFGICGIFVIVLAVITRFPARPHRPSA